MVGPLIGTQALLKDVVDPLFLGPLQVPARALDLLPLSTLKSLEDAVLEGGPEGDLLAAWGG